MNFPFLNGVVPRRTYYRMYISQLIRFARMCNHVDDFNARNKCLTAKVTKRPRAIGIINFEKLYSYFLSPTP